MRAAIIPHTKAMRLDVKRMFLAITVLFALASVARGEKNKCIKITTQMCQNIGYNYTRYPNFMEHETQEAAKSSINEFTPLVAINCAPQLRFFLCSVYVPLCTKDFDFSLKPCRATCELARDGCVPVMEKFGYKWPDRLDCKQFPKHGDPRAKSDPKLLCIRAPNVKHTPLNTSEFWKNFDNIDPKMKKLLKSLGKLPDGKTTAKPSVVDPDDENGVMDFQGNESDIGALSLCGNQSGRLNLKYVYVEDYDLCVPRCNEDVFFSQSNKRFAEVWISVWSILCFISTAITVLTFAIDTSRFKYPERPIIFLSICYNLYSIAHIIRLGGGREIACDSQRVYSVAAGMSIADHASCSVVFLMLYYFGMASALWWVLLTFAWFLSASLKWGQEAIEAKATFFHVIAWTVPAVQTMLVLIMRKVDADELSGLCYVGSNSAKDLAGYVIAPLCVYVIIGVIFLLAGFVSLCRIRQVLKDKETKTDKLEKLMVRIGVFSILYSIPMTTAIGCYLYEHSNRKKWMATMVYCQITQRCPTDVGPQVEVFMVKHFMLLVVGTTASVWIWSVKTFQSWRGFYNKRLAKKSRPSSSGARHDAPLPPKRALQTEPLLQGNVAYPVQAAEHQPAMNVYVYQPAPPAAVASSLHPHSSSNSSKPSSVVATSQA